MILKQVFCYGNAKKTVDIETQLIKQPPKIGESFLLDEVEWKLFALHEYQSFDSQLNSLFVAEYSLTGEPVDRIDYSHPDDFRNGYLALTEQELIELGSFPYQPSPYKIGDFLEEGQKVVGIEQFKIIGSRPAGETEAITVCWCIAEEMSQVA
jgi:hypothetical protein